MKNTKMTAAQKWEAATFADNFIFCRVMTEYPDICRELLEILLGIRIERIEVPISERTVKTDLGAKGVRFDVYVKDGDGRAFDIEIQTTRRKNLARRARYYQSMMDIDCLEIGEDYGELRDSYVIFLCMDDVFGKGFPVYTFENRCAENPDVRMDDGARKIFFNASKYDKMPDEQKRAFFKYLRGTKAESDFAARIDRCVGETKKDPRWREQYMTWEQEMKIQARELAEELAPEIARDMAEDMAKDMAQDMAKDIAQGMAKDMAQGMAKDMAQGMAKDIAKDMAKDMAQDMAKNIAQDMTQDMAEDMARKMLGRGYSEGETADLTGLPLELVQQLAKDTKL